VNAPRAPAIERWITLGELGFVVSICYGPARGKLRWSVDVVDDETKRHFRRSSAAARSFAQCVDIAELEIVRNGWAPGALIRRAQL
jgi:hypothetical protein